MIYDPFDSRAVPSASPKNIPIPTNIMQNILTDQMVKGLASIESLFEKRVPLHQLASKKVSVTDVPVEVNLGEWVRATLFSNLGSGNVYVYNTRQNADTRDAYLAAGDNLPIDREERTRDRFYLVCAVGETATVRIFYQ